ncbi:uncharacterized protein LOC128962525 [Oppia nitens]|uniref:uncharacterized protein LOC128962524 n=1 Tax=Oppia nitens TaxID=1686743 RepID=UPI0023DB9A78|nr:uncharacterized protein LOC128962524 [Oppia nitens]XP_054164875.1 uncharacterized protein LOC128962525 [Oppia nitens]
MTIIGQFSEYDYVKHYYTGTEGQGSIVFMNINSTIKYCYVGLPFNNTACLPKHLKTLIDCSKTPTSTPTSTPPPKTQSYLITLLILIVTSVILMSLIIGIVLCFNASSGREDEMHNVFSRSSVRLGSTSPSSMSKVNKKRKTGVS